MLGAGLLGLVAGLTYWAPKLTGRLVPATVSAAALLAVLAGITLAAGGQFLVAFGADESVGRISLAGFGLLALAIAVLASGLFGRGEVAPSDPYEGLTLEWLTASPPVRHNFDELPIVRSPQPLADARADSEDD